MKNLMIFIRPLVVVIAGLASAVSLAFDRPSPEGLAEVGLETNWVSQAVMDVRRDTVSHIRNDEENVYIQSSSGILTVLHAENGRQRWFAQVGRTTDPSTHAVSNDDTVLVIAGPVAFGFNKFDGTPLFEFRLPRYPTAAPAIDSNTFYVPLNGGAIYAYSLKVLEYQYRFGTLPNTVAKPHVWRFICAENIIHPPVIGDNGVAFVTEAGSLHALRTTGFGLGQSRFQLLLNEPASGPPGIARNQTSHSIFMTTRDYQIFSVDLDSGRREWVYPHGRLILQPPVAVGTEVYIVSEDRTLTQFSRDPLSLSLGRPREVPRITAPNSVGVSLEAVQIDPDIQNAFQLAVPEALQIRDVVPGGAADVAGLRPGDRITSVDGFPVASVEEAGLVFAELPPGVNRGIDVVRVSMGAGMTSVPLSPPVEIAPGVVADTGIELTEVRVESPAEAARLQSGDIVVAVDNNPVTSPAQLRGMLASVAPAAVALKVLRGDESAQVNLNLAYKSDIFGRTSPESAIRLEQRQIRIAQTDWDVSGVASLTAVGRFGVYGLDVSNHLVGFDRRTSKAIGRTPATDYIVPHTNSVTDLLYLSSESGEILCLKEIGPTVTVPDLGPDTRQARVRAIGVRRGDSVEPSGTTLCQLETSTGDTFDFLVQVKGTVHQVLVSDGDLVEVGQPLFRISEDRFATYHRQPEKRPIDLQPAADDS